jgi:uncharacterized protein
VSWLLAYLLTGALAGVLAGLLGIGGGLIVVPVLVWLFRAQDFPAESLMHAAVGTSLGVIVFTALSSALAHQRRSAVLWPLVALLAPGVVLGALAGAWLAATLSAEGLRGAFGLFLLSVAAWMILDPAVSPQRRLPGPVASTLVAGGIGLLSGLVGIAGGTMTVPFLVWCNVNMRQAVGTSAALGLPLAVAAAGGFMLTGRETLKNSASPVRSRDGRPPRQSRKRLISRESGPGVYRTRRR